MGPVLQLLGAGLWLFYYGEAFRLAMRRHTCAVPLWAATLGLAYDAYAAILSVQTGGFTLLTWILSFWAVLDVVVLLTYLAYGRPPWPSAALWSRLGWTAVALTVSISAVSLYRFLAVSPYQQGTQTGSLVSLFASICFLLRYAFGQDHPGQSLLLGWSRLIAAAVMTLQFGLADRDPFVMTCSGLAAVFQGAYVFFLHSDRPMKIAVRESAES